MSLKKHPDISIVDIPNYGGRDQELLRSILARPLFAHLATSHADGPRHSPVWFLWEDDALWIIANEKDAFPQRITAEPRCAIGIVDFDVSSGRVHHAGFRGRATVEPWEPKRARRLLRRYLGEDEARWDSRFRATVNNASNHWIRFIPETAVIRDQSYEPNATE